MFWHIHPGDVKLDQSELCFSQCDRCEYFLSLSLHFVKPNMFLFYKLLTTCLYCRFGVFGVGSQAYGSNFNAVARAFDTHLASLGGVRIVLRGEGDVDEGTVDREFDVWTKGLLEKLEGARLRPHADESTAELVDEDAKVNGYESATLEDGEDSYSDDDSETFEDANDDNFSDGVVDVEDMGGQRKLSEPLEGGQKRGVVRRQPLQKQVVAAPLVKEVKDGPKEMVTPLLRASLEKQVLANSGKYT